MFLPLFNTVQLSLLLNAHDVYVGAGGCRVGMGMMISHHAKEWNKPETSYHSMIRSFFPETDACWGLLICGHGKGVDPLPGGPNLSRARHMNILGHPFRRIQLECARMGRHDCILLFSVPEVSIFYSSTGSFFLVFWGGTGTVFIGKPRGSCVSYHPSIRGSSSNRVHCWWNFFGPSLVPVLYFEGATRGGT